VISRTSTFSYKGKDVPLRQIAEELGVAHVLEGSVRKAGNRVRISAQLIEAKSDAHLWSETYDRTMEDVFVIQDEIAADVVDQLKITLLGDVPTTKGVDPEAYALYLQARHTERMGSADAYEEALSHFESALAIEPDYPAAWDGLAGVYVNQAGKGLRSRASGYALAREAAKEALAINPEYAPAHGRLGWIAMREDGDLATAALRFQRALELAPSDLDILSNSAVLLAELGRTGKALTIQEYKAERDPLDPNSHSRLAAEYLYARRWDDAMASCRSALRLSPDMLAGHFLMGYALVMKGDPHRALERFAMEQSEMLRDYGETMAAHALGQEDKSTAKLRQFVEQWGDDLPGHAASLCGLLGEVDQAFQWLERSLESERPGIAAVDDPGLDSLRSDPRWISLLQRMGKSPEQLDGIEFDVTLPRSRS
jgi:Tfp pilus assembly protein PilF